MKKPICCLVLTAIFLNLCTGCTSITKPNSKAPFEKTSLRVITPYGGDDGNRANYTALVSTFESATGYTVIDESGTSNEEWKAKVNSDFQTGAEPDVLLFFTGTDSDEFVRNNKVVSLEEIRKVYPTYASNMKDNQMPASAVDKNHYAVPVNGYWEALFVNRTVLEACGITTVPNEKTKWAEFMAMCETIKQKGYIPIAASMQEVPHYWFEYAIFNQGSPITHRQEPKTSADEAGIRWAQGLTTIKELYEYGYFPPNTLTATDTETFQLLIDDKAAFAIDGNWKMGLFTGVTNNDGSITPSKVENINNFEVTYVPAKGVRVSSDIISGISMGYYITQKAWNDPSKQEAAVKFVNAMTADAAVNLFAQGAPTALKSGIPNLNVQSTLQKSAVHMMNNCTSTTPAVQDTLNKTARNWLFKSVKEIITGKLDVNEAIDTALSMPLSD